MRLLVGLLFLIGACTSYQNTVEPLDVGVVAGSGSTRTCLTIADSSLGLGQRLTTARIPHETEVDSISISVIEIAEIHPRVCAGLQGAYGDSDYYVRVLEGTSPGPRDPHVAILVGRGELVVRDGLLQVAMDDNTSVGTFRACTSLEGLHLTLWEGTPLRSRRMWHSYFALGYDVEPTCSDADYEAPPE